MEYSANVASFYVEAVAKEGQAATTPRTERTPKQLEAMHAAAEAAKKRAVEREKQREKERLEQEKEKEREKQQQKEQEEKEREERQREEEKRRRDGEKRRRRKERGKSKRNASRKRKRKNGKDARMTEIVAATVTGHTREIATCVNAGVTIDRHDRDYDRHYYREKDRLLPP